MHSIMHRKSVHLGGARAGRRCNKHTVGVVGRCRDVSKPKSQLPGALIGFFVRADNGAALERV